jgi:hypothetical protein
VLSAMGRIGKPALLGVVLVGGMAEGDDMSMFRC